MAKPITRRQFLAQTSGLTTIGAVYVLLSGYWGVVMADFQQGIIALLVIIIVSIWACMDCRQHGLFYRQEIW